MSPEEAWEAHDDGSLSGVERQAFMAGWSAALAASAEYRLVYDWPDGTQSVIDAGSEGRWPPFGTIRGYVSQGWKLQCRVLSEWEEVEK